MLRATLRARYRDFPVYLSHHTCTHPFPYQQPSPEGWVCHNGWTYIHTKPNHPKSVVCIGFTPDIVHSMGVDRCIMICVHHYGVIEYFHCPKNLLCSTYSTRPPGNHWVFTLSPVFPLPECHIQCLELYAT